MDGIASTIQKNNTAEHAEIKPGKFSRPLQSLINLWLPHMTFSFIDACAAATQPIDKELTTPRMAITINIEMIASQMLAYIFNLSLMSPPLPLVKMKSIKL
jgi:hypothetical protein